MSLLGNLIPKEYPKIRDLVDTAESEGHVLLLSLLSRLHQGQISFGDLALNNLDPAEEEKVFIQKLRIIMGLAVVYQARDLSYSLEEQIDDFLLFRDTRSLLLFRYVSRFRTGSLQPVLWAIQEEEKLAAKEELPFGWRLPVDILVAIGDEVSRWHEGLLQDIEKSYLPPEEMVGEESLRALMKGSLLETAHFLHDELAFCTMTAALDRVRARFGICSISMTQELGVEFERGLALVDD